MDLWLCFLSNFNEKPFFFEDTWLNSSKLNLFTDASGALDFGAVLGLTGAMGNGLPVGSSNIAIFEFLQL